MFDHLRIDPYMLPVSVEEKSLLARSCRGKFQTKSLHRSLTMVEITHDGRLIWATFDEELYWREEDLPEEYIVKEGEEFLMLMGGCVVPERMIRWVEEKDYSGVVKFYDNIEKTWYEFCAHFSKGKLTHIEKLLPLPQPPDIPIV